MTCKFTHLFIFSSTHFITTQTHKTSIMLIDVLAKFNFE